ncbi:DUF58 domain-containing protein [Litoribrevibacter euphylliae]|uniref:DUF58 domain-containing protein n=1 Tax=Litoribrevibacter euphylliae TaxID=1834034 RepID=A0ABV7H754_9GAMM
MQRFRQWFDAWLARRSPVADKVRLSNRNIYIFPSKPGWLLISVLFVTLLTAINYQNSLVFGACFWLGSVFAILIWHTWKNLASLEVIATDEVAGFVDEIVHVNQNIKPLDRNAHFNVQLRWRVEEPEDKSSHGVDLDAGQTESLMLNYRIRHRGWNKTPRLEVFTRYPMGILTAWSVIQLDHPVLGFPKPLFDVVPTITSEGDSGDDEATSFVHSSKQSGSDFDGLTPYIQGDSLKKVDWKRYAKTEELVTKSFVTPPVSNHWLRFDDFQGIDIEKRLSALAGWVIRWTERNQHFGLSLPNIQIQPNSGEQHQFQCLRALALYGASGQTDSESVMESAAGSRV